MKKLIFRIVFFLVMTGLTLYYLISSHIFESLGDLKNVSIAGLFLILAAVAGYMLCDAFIIYRSLHSFRKEATYHEGIGTYAFGNLGSLVTPWKSAHFPMIMYYLRKKRYTPEEALSVMANNQMIYSMVLPVLYSIFLVYAVIHHSYVSIGEKDLPLWLVSFFGILTNIGYFTVLMFMLYMERFQTFILNIEYKVLKKFKRISDDEAWYSEKRTKMKVYKETANRIWKKPVYYLPSILAYILFMFLCYGVPYFCYLVITKNGFQLQEYMQAFMLFQAMSYVTNILPVPGGMGAAEFSFLTVYQSMMGASVNLAVLLFRFFTFVLFILYDFVYYAISQLWDELHKRKEKS